MTCTQHSRKRIGQALGLLALGLVLLVGGAEYGQAQLIQDHVIILPPGMAYSLRTGRTDADGRVSIELKPDVFFRVPPRGGVNKRQLNDEHSVAQNEPFWLSFRENDSGDIIELLFALGLSTGSAASHAADAAFPQQAQKIFFVRLIKDDGPKGFKVKTQGKTITITSHFSDATLWPMEVARREYQLKVGQQVRLTGLPEKTAELYSEKLYNPVVRFNTQPNVAEAQVISTPGPQGEPFGEIEFTAKAAGETIIGIDYEFYSHITTEYMGLADILVKVTVQ